MIIVFLGPPYAGKGTQAYLLGKNLNLRIFSMGGLIRDAREKGDEVIKDAYEKYSLKGLNIPTDIKFNLLRKKMEEAGNNFILDNFPATIDDLNFLLDYLNKKDIEINTVIHLTVSKSEMLNRLNNTSRGRADDKPEIVESRRNLQDEDRKPVLDYFRNKGILKEVNGEDDVENVRRKILEAIHD